VRWLFRSDFQRYWVGEALSTLGTRTSLIAYPLLTLSLTGSPARAGLVSFVRLLPWLTLSLPAGVLVDRIDRRRLLLVCDAVSMTAMAAIVIALAAGSLVFWQLLLVAAVDGSAAMVFRVGEVGAIKHLVPAEETSSAVAQNTARDAAASLAGPPLGGLLYGVDRLLPFAANAVSCLASMVMLASIRTPFQHPREQVRWHPRLAAREIGEGLRWLWARPFLRLSEFLVAGSNFATNAISLLLVLTARAEGASSGEIGFMLGIAAAGGLAGSIAARWMHRPFSPRLIVIAYSWVGVSVTLALASTPPPLALGTIFAVWLFFGPTWDAVVVGYRIRVVPDTLQGRVESVSALISFGAAALGPLAVGIIAAHVSARSSFLILAGWITAIALAGSLAPSTRQVELDPVPQ
jgi:MFS family permease